MIRIAGVSKTFSVKDNKVEALKNVSLDIAKGDIYGIIGMSGAGKSTLVRCLNFLERPTEGTVYVEEQDLSTLDAKQLRQLRKHVAMIFQNFNLLFWIMYASRWKLRAWIKRQPGKRQGNF